MYMVNKFSLSLPPHQSELARLQVFRIWRLDFHVGELTFRVETWHVGNTHTYTHTHTCLTALYPGYPGEPVPGR